MLAVWPGVPRVNEIGIDPWVLGFALVVSLVTGLAFGLLPALRAAGAGVEEVLREEGGARRARAGATGHSGCWWWRRSRSRSCCW